MIKFPYGISDFHRVITGGYFYIDRTPGIRRLEEAGDQLLFLRPRRMGKSLLLSMIENYYDLARAGEFEQLFGQLAIGQTPTALHNQYFIMTWDFSAVDVSGDVAQIRQAVYNHINAQVYAFSLRYATHLSIPITINPADGLASLASALTAVQQTPYKVYLLIDEYDNFANEVLMSSLYDGRKRYDEMVKGEGFFKTIFKAIKSASRGQGIERVFITGVSPLVMSDFSSGYNVATNIYLEPDFYDLCGFTEAEVGAVLDQVAVGCQFAQEKRDEIFSMMRTFYNGYRFTLHRQERLYNPTLVLYFLRALQNLCTYPDEMLDNNLAMDRSRIAYVAQLGGAEPLVLAALDETQLLTTTTLAQRFGVTDILSSEAHSPDYLAALLYYLGVLTLEGRNTLQRYVLRIPNLVVRELYVERLRELLLPGRADRDAGRLAADTFFLTGDLQPLCTFVEQRLFSVFDNRDYLAANELTIKTTFLTLLFNDKLYLVDSETAIRRTYADLTLILRPDLRDRPVLSDFILEFKYMKLSEAGLAGKAIQALQPAEFHRLPVIQAQIDEARTQLQTYRRDLIGQYGGTLRLRTYAVVALGFERLLWVEILP